MYCCVLLLGVLLSTAPLLSQSLEPSVKAGRLLWLSLTETRADIVRMAGTPASVTHFGVDYESWQYHADDGDHHDPSWYLVFRRSTGALISVTRVYAEERNVDQFFPPAGTVLRQTADRTFGARVYRPGNGRLLVAIGSVKPGDKLSQLLLIRETEVRNFQPWLQMEK